MILYKYFPANEYSFKTLSVKGLWCGYHNQMNDPFECLAFVNRTLTKEQIDLVRSYCRNTNNHSLNNISLADDNKIQELFNLMRTGAIDKFAFCSLSEKPDNILMWSHYANSHKGFVIGYEFDDLTDHHFQKVTYSDKLLDFDIISVLEILNERYDTKYMNSIFNDYSVKASCWEYEQEWRIWRNSPSYYLFKPKQLKEIYFGVNCDIETKSIVLQLTSYLPKEFLYYEMELADNPIRLVAK